MANFMNINHSIDKELHEVETMLKDIGKSFAASSTEDIFNYFFKIPGKYLRPTLVLLSAKTVNPKLTLDQRNTLIRLSVAVELIHSASLIHDDIIDADLIRRGQKTLNNVYGRKIAVLAGDALYAKAFSILSSSLPREAEQEITQVIEKMCTAEIIQARHTAEIIQARHTAEIMKAQDSEVLKQRYFKIIEGKTAIFMSACCKLGAVLASAKEDDVLALESYGLNFGMAYQIIDDCIDGDPNAVKNVTIDEGEQLALKAKASIERFELSASKQGLINLLKYVLNFSKSEIKKD